MEYSRNIVKCQEFRKKPVFFSFQAIFSRIFQGFQPYSWHFRASQDPSERPQKPWISANPSASIDHFLARKVYKCPPKVRRVRGGAIFWDTLIPRKVTMVFNPGATPGVPRNSLRKLFFIHFAPGGFFLLYGVNSKKRIEKVKNPKIDFENPCSLRALSISKPPRSPEKVIFREKKVHFFSGNSRISRISRIPRIWPPRPGFHVKSCIF